MAWNVGQQRNNERHQMWREMNGKFDVWSDKDRIGNEYMRGDLLVV